MKKKTFYILLSVWILAIAVFAGVLINHFVNNDDVTPSGPPAAEQPGDGDSEDDDDDKNWTGNY